MVIYSNLLGDVVKVLTKKDRLKHEKTFGNGRFPYNNISREYEADINIKNVGDEFNADAFDCVDPDGKYVNHSFGVEIETAAGYIPEEQCFDYGLIPLRDGSITGIEYATMPLGPGNGLSILKEQLKLLKTHTIGNKECSIHVHIGGFPVNPSVIFSIYKIWRTLQSTLENTIIPVYSYHTENFKANGKNYCAKLPLFNTFNEMYEYFVGCPYLGSLYQPHPRDIEKKAKWNIKSRYHNLNFINALCYNSAKTIEFRFITHTYSYEKIKFFIMLFNAIVNIAELMANKYTLEELEKSVLNDITIDNLLNIYPREVRNRLKDTISKLMIVINNQNVVGDYYGGRIDLEQRVFKDA